jgi:hypothetical protein
MKKIILGLIALSSISAFAQNVEICGKVQSLTISGDRLNVKLDSVERAYFVESAGAGSVAAIAKANDMKVCISSFYAKGYNADAPKDYAGYLTLKD